MKPIQKLEPNNFDWQNKINEIIDHISEIEKNLDRLNSLTGEEKEDQFLCGDSVHENIQIKSKIEEAQKIFKIVQLYYQSGNFYSADCFRSIEAEIARLNQQLTNLK
jgi:hypothetical protein